MEEKNKKFPLSIYEIILLLIAIPVIFYYSGKLFWQLEESKIPTWFPWWMSWFSRWFKNWFSNLFDWFGSFWGVLSVLVFNLLWIAFIRQSYLKSLRVKIYLTVFIVTMSAMLLVSWIAVMALRGSMH